MEITVLMRRSFSERSVHRVLVGVLGLNVDVSKGSDDKETILKISGNVQSAEILLGVQILCPDILEFLDINPVFEDGILGIMQLITLTNINQELKKLLIK